MNLKQPQLKSFITLTVISLISFSCSQGAALETSVRTVSLAEFSSAEQPIADSVDLEFSNDKTEPLGHDEPSATASADNTSSTQVAETTQANPTINENIQERSAIRLDKPGDRIVVDSFVGQVNGRPIYADDFLSALEDRLVEVAAEKTGQERKLEFEQIISGRLVRVVKNELILADAESTLSEQEQLGLLAFLKSRQEELIRQTGSGGRYEAENELRRDIGVESLEELFDFQRDQILIAQLRRHRIEPRVIVSWRDIEQEYNRRFDDFNPHARVTLSRIRFNKEAEAEKIELVKTRLEAGDDFTDIANDLKIAKGGVWDTFELGDGGINEIGVADRFKKKLQGLGQGDTTEPIESETSASVIWLHIKQVIRPKARSLFDHDVQQELADYLHELRTNEETERYIRSLFEEGIFDELEDMGRRLVTIALQRYAK